MTPFSLPSDYARIKRVHSFEELVTTPLAQGVNALCWQRTLTGDFGEVVTLLGGGEGIRALDEACLRALPLSAAGRVARDELLADLRRLQEHALDPVLNCIDGYPRDEEPGPVVTDVFSFHADSAPIEASTYLCTYYGPASEGLRNDEALRRVDLPATRAELLKLYGGADDADFRVYLNEHCYDLHYAPVADARPISDSDDGDVLVLLEPGRGVMGVLVQRVLAVSARNRGALERAVGAVLTNVEPAVNGH